VIAKAMAHNATGIEESRLNWAANLAIGFSKREPGITKVSKNLGNLSFITIITSDINRCRKATVPKITNLYFS
jgi:hypothetical protein